MEVRSPLEVFFLVQWIFLHVLRVDGYPGGAPNSSCTSLMPSHGAPPQTTEAPYDIIVAYAPNKGSYSATKNQTVRISGINGTTFKGFMLQARQYNNGGTNFATIGSFQFPSNVKAICQSGTVTHTDANEKTSVDLIWLPPQNATGNVKFWGSIVQTEYVFWQFSPSFTSTGEVVTVTGVFWQSSPSFTSTGEVVTVTGAPPLSVDTSECGKTKGCYLSNCDTPNSGQCEHGVMWSSAPGGGTAYELFASIPSISTPWIALGLSHDGGMGDDSVTDCIYNPKTGAIDVQMSWNDGDNNFVLSNKSLSLVSGTLSGSFSNGFLVCRFTRVNNAMGTTTTTTNRTKRQTMNQIFYPAADLYNILIAKGPASNGDKLQHTFHPAASPYKVNFTEYLAFSDNPTLSPLIKAHGIMMIFAWMVFASFGILMPRYFKTAWPGKKWGGKAIWFQLHQPLMAISLILTAAAFIIIFIEAEGYSTLESPAVAHPPLGIIVMALVLINPIMAIFRPDPNDKHRLIFNIFHFLVGLIAHLSAAVTIFLATYIIEVGMPEWCRWVMVGYICWHALIEIILALHMHLSKGRKGDYSLQQDIAMHQPGHESRPETEHRKSCVESYSLFQTVLSVLHLIGVLGCSIALSVQIGIS